MKVCVKVTDAFTQLNRFARLAVEVDLGAADRFQLQRNGRDFWMVDTRKNPNDFPELTESVFARAASMTRRYSGERQFIKRLLRGRLRSDGLGICLRIRPQHQTDFGESPVSALLLKRRDP